jgi:hypothetical protein
MTVSPERFVRVYQKAASLEEASSKLGLRKRQTQEVARSLRLLGVHLKHRFSRRRRLL